MVAHSAAFEKAIGVTPVDAQTYSAHLDPKWSIGMVPHGGYVASVFYRTTTVHFQNTHADRFPSTPEPISFQLCYLRRTIAGPATLKVQEIKLGSRVSTIHVTLLQAADKAATPDELEVKVVAYINASPPESESGPSYEGVWGLQPEPEPVAGPGTGAVDLSALARNQEDGNWERLKIPYPAMFAMQNTELYAPRPVPSPSLESQAERVVDQWGRLTPGGQLARWSNEAVVFLLDMFPVALERLAALEALRLRDENAFAVGSGQKDRAGPFWFPTVSMNIDLKTRLPPQGVEWLFSRVETKMLRNSRADLEVTLLDAKGGLVATSNQVALVVDASRNSKARKEPTKASL